MNVPTNTPQSQQTAPQPANGSPANPLLPGTREEVRQVALLGYN